MRSLIRVFSMVILCFMFGVLSAGSVNAGEGSGHYGRSYHHGQSFHKGNRAEGRAHFSGHERRVFRNHGFHRRSTVVYYPGFYGYYPNNYTYYSVNHSVYTRAYVDCSYNYGPGYPAIGTVFVSLPFGCSTLVLNGATFYTSNGIYYQAAPQGYVVVPPPC